MYQDTHDNMIHVSWTFMINTIDVLLYHCTSNYDIIRFDKAVYHNYKKFMGPLILG